MSNNLEAGTLLKGPNYTYKIEKVLGQGSFGITYLATTKVKISGALGELETTMKVAVKEFFMKDINDREGSSVSCGNKDGMFDHYKKKFAKEAQNLSRVNHPYIIKVLEAFEANNTYYYAMEYCDGGSLETVIKLKGRIKEEDSKKYLTQIGEALTFMHTHRMLHLDLKPSNIMLRANGDVALIDFGLSKQYDENGAPESSTNVGGGTPGYAPLEQASYCEGKDFPVTMDVYALGGTLYKMLTGERPAEASVLLNEGFPTDFLKSKGLSDKAVSCIEKAMAPTKRLRFQTIEELVSTYLKEDLSGSEETRYAAPEKPKATESTTEETVYNEQPKADISPVEPEPKHTSKPVTSSQKPAVKPVPKTPVKDSGKKSATKYIVLTACVAVIGAVAGWALMRPAGNDGPKFKKDENGIRVIDFTGLDLYPMVEVKGGTFEMGHIDADDAQPHNVTVCDFYMGQCEVSRKLWKEIMNGEDPSENQPNEGAPERVKELYPVENVSFEDVQLFIRRLNARTGMHFSLPTEAQWEYAARGGQKTQNYRRFSGVRSPNQIHYGKDKPTAVNSKVYPANELGIYQMSGNVAEWCLDLYDSDFYTNTQNSCNPVNTTSGSYRVIRGGSYDDDNTEYITVFYRGTADTPEPYIGFRLVINQ